MKSAQTDKVTGETKYTFHCDLWGADCGLSPGEAFCTAAKEIDPDCDVDYNICPANYSAWGETFHKDKQEQILAKWREMYAALKINKKCDGYEPQCR